MSLAARLSQPPLPMAHALHAEWTKLRTVPGPAWLLAGVVTHNLESDTHRGPTRSSGSHGR